MRTEHGQRDLIIVVALLGGIAYLLAMAQSAPTTIKTGKPVIERLGPYLDTEQARALAPKRAERLGPAANPPSAEGIAISQKKIMIGMTSQQVLRAWGRPEKINETHGARYHHEQWVYAANYLYFDNGILTTWQTSR
jgi:hypothetical protein